MKRIYSLAFICLMTVCSPLFGKVIETEHFNEIVNFVTPDTLVILDIDDTLLVPTQTLGTDVWFIYRRKQHEAAGVTPAQALEKAISEWEAVRHLTNVKIVEEGTDEVIIGLQEQNLTVMGLSTQGLALATCTVNQLRSLNIDLSKTAPSNEDHYFINKHGVLYRHGILFTSGTPKGPALLKLLDVLDYSPKQIVFINDKATHVHDVEESVESRGIDFIGLRYSYSDQRVASFRKEIADIQWSHSTFDHLLSDEEAEELLSASLAQ